ncbi:GAF domain-containing protein [Streptomyces sp. NPDC052301]|uniref:GAF domain-containing protein n=1 Tax=Streptomyces sp. NPDC052301 TaxID=3365687 RepID=UPI0037D7423B
MLAVRDDLATVTPRSARAGKETTQEPGSCGAACRIRDVASATVFDKDSRHVILHAGSRACHSVPLLDERDVLLGVISSHHARPIAGFTRSRLAALHETAGVVGRWLARHRRTVILDALEDLRRTARRR